MVVDIVLMGYCVSDHQNMCMGGCLSLDFLKKIHVFGHQPTDDPPGYTCSEYLKDISRSYRQHLTDSTQRTMMAIIHLWRYAPPAMKFQCDGAQAAFIAQCHVNQALHYHGGLVSQGKGTRKRQHCLRKKKNVI
jgi:hypothetical protein